jgi:hypothetical protein
MDQERIVVNPYYRHARIKITARISDRVLLQPNLVRYELNEWHGRISWAGLENARLFLCGTAEPASIRRIA